MKELKYIEKIRDSKSILSLPHSLSQVLAMVGSDDFSIGDLIKIIMQDAGLTTSILKTANSSFYGQRQEISTLNQAVMTLGIVQVKCLALSASVFQVDKLKTKYHIDIKSTFCHFVGVSIASKMLASEIDKSIMEEAFIAGLLHDIGIVYFLHHFPEDYQAVVENISNYSSRTEAELDILGIDHGLIGQMLAKKWEFPANLCNAIGKHHESLSDDRDKDEDNVLTSIVQLADYLNPSFNNNGSEQIENRISSVNQLRKILGLEQSVIENISVNLPKNILDAADSFGIDVGDSIELMERANHELYYSFITIEHLFRERRDLSQRILNEERRSASLETKNVAIATLSHYINNAAMAISGRAQMLKLMKDNDHIIDKENRLDPTLHVIDKSLQKIMAVILELRDLTNLEEMEKYNDSKAINIDDRIAKRLKLMESDSGVLTPEDNINSL